MAKEKNYNPVQAQRKADKAREVKKGKAEAKGRRDEKLARKNPERIQKQIDDLKAVTEKGGKLSKHEEQVLAGLEAEIKAVRRARDALGDKAPSFGGAGGRSDFSHSHSHSNSTSYASAGQKRRRGGGGGSDSDSEGDDVPEDVRRIPMPRDTPPPIPKAELDRWFAKRRARREAARRERGEDGNKTYGDDNKDKDKESKDSNKDGGDRSKRVRVEEKVESRTVYEAKPVVRDLRKEAVAAFVPTAVQMKMSKGRGQGGLLEPEEADRLEREGYMRTGEGSRDAGGDVGGDGSGAGPASKRVTVEDADEE